MNLFKTTPKTPLEALRKIHASNVKEDAWLVGIAKRNDEAKAELEAAKQALAENPTDSNISAVVSATLAVETAALDRSGTVFERAASLAYPAVHRQRAERNSEPLKKAIGEILETVENELDAQIEVERAAAISTGIDAAQLKSPRRAKLEQLRDAAKKDLAAEYSDRALWFWLGELDPEFTPPADRFDKFNNVHGESYWRLRKI